MKQKQSPARNLLTSLVVAGVTLAAAGGCGHAPAPYVDDADASSAEHYPSEPASDRFWSAWSDGLAEVSSYRLRTPRYGEQRDAVTVLIFVLEEMDRRTWIKNDVGDVPAEHRTVVMKLINMTRFQTGVYPYSVMTSVFSPVGGIGRPRFSPTRIVLTSQEWCGQVYHRVMPEAHGFRSEIRSYFSVEGETEQGTATGDHALYEDALLIQLRELDGPFADGGPWQGHVVPTLWRGRLTQEPLRSEPAELTRSDVVLDDGKAVTRFVLRYEDRSRAIDIERDEPRRVIGWSTSEGEHATIVATEHMAYWQLGGRGDESYRERLGLEPTSPEFIE